MKSCPARRNSLQITTSQLKPSTPIHHLLNKKRNSLAVSPANKANDELRQFKLKLEFGKNSSNTKQKLHLHFSSIDRPKCKPRNSKQEGQKHIQELSKNNGLSISINGCGKQVCDKINQNVCNIEEVDDKYLKPDRIVYMSKNLNKQKKQNALLSNQLNKQQSKRRLSLYQTNKNKNVPNKNLMSVYPEFNDFNNNHNEPFQQYQWQIKPSSLSTYPSSLSYKPSQIFNSQHEMYEQKISKTNDNSFFIENISNFGSPKNSIPFEALKSQFEVKKIDKLKQIYLNTQRSINSQQIPEVLQIKAYDFHQQPNSNLQHRIQCVETTSKYDVKNSSRSVLNDKFLIENSNRFMINDYQPVVRKEPDIESYSEQNSARSIIQLLKDVQNNSSTIFLNDQTEANCNPENESLKQKQQMAKTFN